MVAPWQALEVSLVILCMAWAAVPALAKDMLLEYLKVKTEGALAQTKPEINLVQMSGQSLSPCCWDYACILPPCSLKRGIQPERQSAEAL